MTFSLSRTVGDLRPGLVGCLARLGGVPEKLVFDNDASVVATGSGSRARLHDEVAGLARRAAHASPIVLRPARPTSKGNVERTIGYAETSFLPLRDVRLARRPPGPARRLGGRRRVSPPHPPPRRHGRRSVPRRARLPRGRCPDPLPDTDLHLEARAGGDAFVRVLGVDYSVPPAFVGRRVGIRVDAESRSASPARAPRSRATTGASCRPTSSWRRRTAGRSGSPGRPATGWPPATSSCPRSISPGTTRSSGSARERDAAELAFLSAALKAPRIKAVSGRLAERARDEGWDYEAYLAAVLSEEVSSRDSHGGAARVKAARFPATKTLDDFDFTIQTSVSRTLIAHLAQLDFLAEAKNVVFLGPPGTGKTHLSIALGVQAARRGQRVAFATAAWDAGDRVDRRRPFARPAAATHPRRTAHS